MSRVAPPAAIGSLLDKSTPRSGKGKRETDTRHLKLIRQLPCLDCGAPGPCDVSHVRMGSFKDGKANPGIGKRPSDRWCVPQLHAHHMLMHATGERTFWEAHGIDVIEVAKALYAASPDLEKMQDIVRRRKP